MTRLILIRHGETDWNVEGRYQGQADPPLNECGLGQAHHLAEELRGVGLNVLYTSPLRRALQTAQILAGTLGLPLQIEPRLMEIHQGDWQGRLHAEIAAHYPNLFRRWQTEPWTVTLPGGESLAQVQVRVYAAVDEILAQQQGQCVGLVTHRIPFALISARYQDLDLDALRSLPLPNAYWEEVPVEARQIGVRQTRLEDI